MAHRTLNGPTVRVLREALGISQGDLAARCQISAAYLSQLESGVRLQPSPDVVKAIAEGLGAPLESVTYPTPAPEPEARAS